MTDNKGGIIWVVVLVESGIPTLVELYRDETAAIVREQSLRKDMRADYDEVGIFEVAGEVLALA
jgi:hypothetical protein